MGSGPEGTDATCAEGLPVTAPSGDPTPGALDDDDFDRLYRHAWPGMVHLARLLTGDPAAAEDLVQDAFARTYRRWPQMTDVAGAAGYVKVAVVNGARSWHRRRRTRALFAMRLNADGSESAFGTRVAEDERIRRSLLMLPHRQREVLVLRYWLDLPEADIARTLGISRGTVKSSASKALATLRRIAGDERP